MNLSRVLPGVTNSKQTLISKPPPEAWRPQIWCEDNNGCVKVRLCALFSLPAVNLVSFCCKIKSMTDLNRFYGKTTVTRSDEIVSQKSVKLFERHLTEEVQCDGFKLRTWLKFYI